MHLYLLMENIRLHSADFLFSKAPTARARARGLLENLATSANFDRIIDKSIDRIDSYHSLAVMLAFATSFSRLPASIAMLLFALFLAMPGAYSQQL